MSEMYDEDVSFN